ncbi:unnamed protein product [Dimorphilus gyrociliatus]|uniref:TIR domain-containing protein n=1 Tax=Dimorphilus gyrociliatus TaxID=2664684 RepID=A0A7I8W892_9ANNE|nr:unnamed protein product [Dimorphilus gyrociliatus]
MESKHVMLSYQHGIQPMVEIIYNGLEKLGISVWMDIKGGMTGNINESMAYGVDNAAAVCCFMTHQYSESKNCKKELNYTDSQDIEIVPVMAEKSFKATGWLGIITAGLLWIDFRENNNMEKRIQSLAKEIVHRVGENVTKMTRPQKAVSAPPAVKPGRAFKHKLQGKYLAESGEVKVHAASGSRSTLTLRNSPEATSFWIEERKEKNSPIYFYKNYSSNGYLGYDPNGNYIYTKGQHYGAEEWQLIADETSTNGERAVIIFANYGKKYLAIRNGKLTGVADKQDDCIWYLD